MRILLLSLGLGAVPRYLRKGATLGFVPTAGEPYADPYFVREDRARLEQLGYKLVDIDLSRQSAAQVRSSLAPIEALFVAGGNTFLPHAAIVRQRRAGGGFGLHRTRPPLYRCQCWSCNPWPFHRAHKVVDRSNRSTSVKIHGRASSH